MNTVDTQQHAETAKTKKVTTTLFDLIAHMQDDAAGPVDESFIVPTVSEWIRSGRIKFNRNTPTRTAA